ncbi:MAG: alanine dehydrogenase [Candidatus Marinimicrobia bacterium]|nr:alanine dehydrogenase [Candidatus Neomarinimicrobiota bacterium]
MIIGIPKEIKNNENRVSLLPFGVEDLSRLGHTVIVQSNAGTGSGFVDNDYLKAGAKIVESPEEVFAHADMIVKVKEPQPEEYNLIREDQVVFTYFHFAASEELTRGMADTGSISIAYETVQTEDNQLPLLIPMSEVAGRMAVQNGAKCLEGNMGGIGKLLSGVPGVEPATVTILGGGVVGMNSAKLAAGLGAKVYILDIDASRLKYLDDIMPSNVFTLYSNSHTIQDLLPKTDLLIGAVLVVGAKAPNLVTRDLLSLMEKGSVIVDVAVDQGGCVETCKPTTHTQPTYEVDGIIHYCVANMPGSVPFTSTIALANATYPYVKQIAEMGCIDALQSNDALLKGLNIYKELLTHKGVAKAFNLEYTPPAIALNKNILVHQ